MSALKRTPVTALVLAAALAGLLAPGATAQESPPPPLPLEELEFPSFEERMLDNGAEVLVVSQAEQPFVTVNLVVRSGTSSDPRNQVGVASMTAGLLTKGTESRSALEIAQAVDFIGASLTAGASTDWTSVTLGVLTPDLDRGLELMADVVMNPTFPQEELEILRQQTLTGLQVQLSQAGAVAGRTFTSRLYGRHPYGKLETPETVESLDQRDVRRFHMRYYKPTNALFIVAGDVEADDVVRRLNAAFGEWTPGAVRPPTYFAPPEREEREVILVHKPGSVQSEIRIGHLLMEGASEDWVPLEVATRVLGGGSQGRLYQVIREEKGWTYGAYASANRRKDVGVFQASMSVRNEVTDSAVAETLRQMEELRTAPVPEEELEGIKSNMTGSFPRQIETPQQIAGQVASYRLMGLSREDLESYRTRVAAVTPDDVTEVVREHVHPSRAAIVVVGDATQVREGLARFGPVTLLDVEGNELALEDITVSESDMAFDASGLEPGQYTYRVSVQGNPLGEFNRMITRESRDGRQVWVASMSMALPGQNVSSRVAFTESFRPMSGSFEVSAQGRSMGSELEYANGRVTGTRTTPQGETRDVDTEAPVGVVMGDMNELAVWITDLEQNTEFRFPAVSLQSGQVSQVRIQVQGTTEVTVPAGTFQAYEVTISSGEGTSRAYFRMQAPHVLLKEEPQSQPIVIELTALPDGGS